MKKLSFKPSRESVRSNTSVSFVPAVDPKERQIYRFAEGEEGWISTSGAEAWRKCIVLSQAGILLTVRVDGKSKSELVDLRTKSVYPSNNARTAPDMTSLHHLNEPCVLYNIEQRSYKDEPGTFIGPVLVAVNPLRPTPPPAGMLGTSKASKYPHPYAIAEYAYSQMAFVGDERRKMKINDYVNQSIIASGESGAGKTEVSKLVLQHLVARSGASGNVDKELLMSNPITEAFGNAKTLRNRNSSRFGKFMRMHFEQVDVASGGKAAFKIAAASVTSYLLERSRVCNREQGERNFHIFYMILGNVGKEMRSALGFDLLKRSGFRYTVPLEDKMQASVTAKDTKSLIESADHDRFVELEQALLDLKFAPQEILELFRLVAGVLHLGNVVFAEKSAPDGEIAVPSQVEDGYDAIDCAAGLFGLDPKNLERLLLERTLETRDGLIVVHRSASEASYTRDAIAKKVYASTWKHIIQRINTSLSSNYSGNANLSDLPFIGVLDIFGFETFNRNGFEQLLINYANEALQSVFNIKVFQSELSLYQRENLVLGEAISNMLPPNNEVAMELLSGPLKNPDSREPHARKSKDAILVDLDLHCREIKPSDEKLLTLYNKKFSKNPCYPPVHPRMSHEKFMIKHYAGIVAYTVSGFIEKNNDLLPKDCNLVFAGCKSRILAPQFKRELRASAPSRGRGRKSPTIVNAFRSQITDLLNVLDNTACSFIRCVKPNPENKRPSGKKKDWLSRPYVTRQLRNLSIAQTAVVLRSGFPTRVSYENLVSAYLPILPKKTAKRFAKGVTNPKLFVAALFWAFKIDARKFRLGHTKVFFKAGEIASLDRVLNQAGAWMKKSSGSSREEQVIVLKRFNYYYARQHWRHALAKIVAQRMFAKLLHNRRAAATKLQAIARAFVAQRRVAHQLESARKRKEAAQALKREQEEEARRLEAEQAAREAEEQKETFVQLTRTATLRREKTLARMNSGGSSDFGSSDEEEQKVSPLPYDLPRSSSNDSDDKAAKMESVVKDIERKASKLVKQKTKGKNLDPNKRAELEEREKRKLMKGYAQVGMTSKRQPPVPPPRRRGSNKSSPSSAATIKRTLRQIDENPYVQSTLRESEATIKREKRGNRSQSNTLKRNMTLTGDRSFSVSQAELEFPVESADLYFNQIKKLASTGEIDEAEFGTLVRDVEGALSHRTKLTHSEAGDNTLGLVQVLCANCGTDNNTVNGAVCRNCFELLPIDVKDYTETFNRPDDEEWAGGAALQYRGGKFYVRVIDLTPSYSSEFEEVTSIKFECAWQGGNRRKPVHIRWSIKLSTDELEALYRSIAKEGTRAFYRSAIEKLPSSFPRMNQPVKAVAKRTTRYSLVKNVLGFASSASRRVSSNRSSFESPGKISNKQYIGQVETWLDRLVEAASEGNKFTRDPKATNIFFKSDFIKTFQVKSKVQELSKVRKL